VCAGVGLRPGGSGPGRVVAAPVTPVVSARRMPAAVGALIADRELAADLNAVFGAGPPPGTTSCLQVDDAGVPVYGHDATTPLIPASDLKLLTGFAALTRLGVADRFVTQVKAAAPPSDGALDGPLYLIGGGDPLLSTGSYRADEAVWTERDEPTTSLASLAASVRAAGITRVTGGVVADDTRFDDVRSVASWDPSYTEDGEVGPVGALVVDDGFIIEGSRPVREYDPATSAAIEFAGLLRSDGVSVSGPIVHGTAPVGGTAVASVASPPLSAIVGEMLRESDNLTAEILTKDIGYAAAGAGTWPAGIQAVDQTLEAAGIPTAGLAHVDGSGLDRSDRVACATLAAVVSNTGPAGRALDAALAVAGSCGTLLDRFSGQAAAQRIAGKTGSLAGVDSLTGVVLPEPVSVASCAADGAPPGGPVTFSFVVNGVASDQAGQAIEDRIADTLVGVGQTPVLDPYEPR
jgi:D-alanyl-D-alanine carboxypeptidase/D-alanyl-D-alanine-endopeptidase (penicillin-binding protein 4)